MKTISSLILVIILSQLSFGQEHSSLFQSETMKKNKVLQVLEYNPEDSLHFFKKFPEGYYSKYDRSGRMIESNNYSSYEKEGVWFPNMFRNYYIYDSLGKNIAFISKYEDGEQPFRSITITSVHESGDSMNMATLTREYQPDFRFTTEPVIEKKAFYGDTILIGKRHKRLISIEDSAIYTDLYYTKQGLIDSTVFHGKGYQHTDRKSIPYISHRVTHYFYFKKSVSEKIIKEGYRILNGVKEEDFAEEYFLFENGLIDKIVRSKYYPDKESNIYVTKFKYTFRKE